MGRSETQNSTDEKFVIVGYTKKCRVQRVENFQLGHGYGYLRAHHLPTDRDQTDITADGKPYWTENWKGSGSGSIGKPNLSVAHSSEPHSEGLTAFYLAVM